MRLWSIHPAYLDSKGLVALWREGLLAQKVLLGETKGYRNHPQLTRFKNTENPAAAIAEYLRYVADEADKRKYQFNRDKISPGGGCSRISVTRGQLAYEFRHLLRKLKARDPGRYQALRNITEIQTHPLFTRIDGGIEDWEVVHRDAAW